MRKNKKPKTIPYNSKLFQYFNRMYHNEHLSKLEKKSSIGIWEALKRLCVSGESFGYVYIGILFITEDGYLFSQVMSRPLLTERRGDVLEFYENVCKDILDIKLDFLIEIKKRIGVPVILPGYEHEKEQIFVSIRPYITSPPSENPKYVNPQLEERHYAKKL